MHHHQEFHVHDDRVQSVAIGVDHVEYGRMISDAQQLIDESKSRADHFEGLSKEIYSQACQQVQQLMTMVQLLRQSCIEKDQSIQHLSNEVQLFQAQLQEQLVSNQNVLSQLDSTKSQTQRLLGHKDYEITRWMSEVSSLLSSKTRLEEGLAALSAAPSDGQMHDAVEAQRTSDPVESTSLSLGDVQSVMSSKLAPLLEAFQTLSGRMNSFENRVSHNSAEIPSDQPSRPQPTSNNVSFPTVPSSGLRLPVRPPGPPPDGGDDQDEGEDDEDDELIADVQAYVEGCTRKVEAPRGRAILNMVSRQFDLDRNRGALLTAQSVFQISLQGYSIKELQDCSSLTMRTLNSIPSEDWPSKRMLGEWLFHQLRNVRKLERTIDQIKRSDPLSCERDFSFLWERLQQLHLEEREDLNARAIEQSLKSPKKSGQPFNKTPAVPAKASPAGPSLSAAVSNPSPPPKKANAKAPPSGKAKPSAKNLTPEQKAKTPCIFFQMPSGCIHGEKRAYPHVKSPPPAKAKTESDAKAKPKPKPKVAAAVAIVAALSSMVAPSQAISTLEWAADSGAGRHLVSFEALRSRAIMIAHLPTLPMTPMKMSGFRLVIGTRTLHSPLDFVIRGASLEMPIISFSTNVPLFGQLALISRRTDLGLFGFLALCLSISSCGAVVVPDVSSDEHAVELTLEPGAPSDLPSAEHEILTPPVFDHMLTHFPKLSTCDVCNRARLYSKRVKSRRVVDEDLDLPEPDAFGQQLACDHLVVFKSAKGNGTCGADRSRSFLKSFAYPPVSREASQLASNLKHFVGLKSTSYTIVRSDAAGEILKAVIDNNWLPESSVPARFPHNSVLEREIRAFQETATSVFLQAGFAARPQLWPQACCYVATAMSAFLKDGEGKARWELAFDKEYLGPRYLLGQLGYVRTKDAGKFKFSPNAAPAIFVGWRLDFGMRYRGVLQFVLYSHLREDASCYPVSQFHDTEVYMPAEAVFPLASAAEAALKELDDPRLSELHDIDSVPVPFVDAEIKHKTRRVYVTYARMLKIGATVGRKGCENDTSAHNAECIASFEEAFGRKDADGSLVEPEPQVPVSSETLP
eukprot:s909_g10.t1